MNKSICIISLSNISIDGRVLRQIDYLSREYEIHVIGYGPIPNKYDRCTNIHWHKIQQPRNVIARTASTLASRFIQIPYFPKTHPAYQLAVDCKAEGYLANNWDALPFAALAARINHGKLVLDIHESYDSWYWGLSSGVIQRIFKKYSPGVGASTTVVRALAEQHSKFNLDPIIVMNAPALPTTNIPLKRTTPDKIHLIHHGVASPSRRIELMIQALALSDIRYDLTLVFTNQKSPYVKKLKKLAEKISPGRITFLSPFLPSEIVQEISQYDVGFYLLPPTSYNNLIALPNKFFEFINAGLAVCIGPSPSMADITNQYHCGVIAQSFEPSDIAELLNQTNTDQWNKMRQASLCAAKVLNADNEMEKVLNIYRRLFADI